MLTAEEIKRIVANTALWLVARETDASFEGERLVRIPQLLSFSALIFVGDWSVPLDVSWSVLPWADKGFLDPTLRCTVENLGPPPRFNIRCHHLFVPLLGIRPTTPPHHLVST